jgi:hypothetical protein
LPKSRSHWIAVPSAVPKVVCWLILPFVPATNDVDAITWFIQLTVMYPSRSFSAPCRLVASLLQLFLQFTKIVLYVALFFICIQTKPHRSITGTPSPFFVEPHRFPREASYKI